MRCSYDPTTKGGNAPDNRKVKGTIHWVSAEHAVPMEVRLFEHLFPNERPMEVPVGVDWVTTVNRDSKQIVAGWAEPCLADAQAGQAFQFERIGYFVCDPDSRPGKPVFNRSVSLRDTWAKIEKKQAE